jgi:hypothetical protein
LLSRQNFLILGGGTFAAGIAGCSGGGGAGINIPGAGGAGALSTAATALPSIASSAPTSSAAASTASPITASVAISRSQTAGAVVPALVGLSYEKSEISTALFTSANANLIGCFTRLGTSVLRIGGNSVDQTTWAPNGSGGTYGQVAPSDINALAAFVQSAGWHIIYGINLATNTAASAAAEAAYASSAFGSSLYGFEIGNECDQYVAKGLRPAGYDLADFISEWSSFASAIRQSVPNAPLTGPASAANTASWTVPFASSEASELKLLTQHYYVGDGQSATSTMSLLLSSSSYLLSTLKQLQSAAASDNIPGGYRLAEANSFYDSGAPGVSNAFGSALWAIDFLLINAQNGSAGANFHGGGDASYTPIQDYQDSVVEVRPIYYGLLFVTQIAPGPMYGVNVTAEVEMTAYAVAGNDGATYLAILNKDPSKAAVTAITLGAGASHATALVLAGPGLTATTNTTLGGASVANNGAWSPVAAQTIPVSGSALTVTVAAATAMLLKIT